MGRRVISLAAIAIATGDRREERQQLERFRLELARQHERRVELGAEHALERLDGLVGEQLVFDDAGAVQHRVDAAAFGIQAIDDGTQRRFIANIAGKVFDLGTGCAQARQIAANFAVGEDARDSAFDLDRLWFFAACERLLEQRSEEHTSELQSLMRISYAVFCLKKKNKQK